MCQWLCFLCGSWVGCLTFFHDPQKLSSSCVLYTLTVSCKMLCLGAFLSSVLHGKAALIAFLTICKNICWGHLLCLPCSGGYVLSCGRKATLAKKGLCIYGKFSLLPETLQQLLLSPSQCLPRDSLASASTSSSLTFQFMAVCCKYRYQIGLLPQLKESRPAAVVLAE